MSHLVAASTETVIITSSLLTLTGFAQRLFFKLLFYLFTELGQCDTLINITVLSMNVNAADLEQTLLFIRSPKAATQTQ